MALVKKTGTVTGNRSISTSLSQIKSIMIYRNVLDSTGLLILCYDEINGTFATFCASYTETVKNFNRDSKPLTVNGGSVTWDPYTSTARLADGKKYTWIAYGEE